MIIDRKTFISLTGSAAAGLLLSACLGSCKKEENATPIERNFILDLDAPENSSLNNNGGSRVIDGVIVARTKTGDYIAVSAKCTHQGTTVQFQSDNNRFRCPNHGATFSLEGGNTGGPADSPLQRFNTELQDRILRIFS